MFLSKKFFFEIFRPDPPRKNFSWAAGPLQAPQTPQKVPKMMQPGLGTIKKRINHPSKAQNDLRVCLPTPRLAEVMPKSNFWVGFGPFGRFQAWPGAWGPGVGDTWSRAKKFFSQNTFFRLRTPKKVFLSKKNFSKFFVLTRHRPRPELGPAGPVGTPQTPGKPG